MPRISQLSTEVAASTSDVIVNVGSTTRRISVGQLLGAIFTSQGQLLYAGSSDNSTFLNPPAANVPLSYDTATSSPAWLTAPSSGAVLVYSTVAGSGWSVVTSGGILMGTAAGTPTWLAPPSSGAVLTFSSASSIAAWSIPTSGAVLVASSVSVPVWRAIGSSGQILQTTGGSPAWVNSTAVLAETLTVAGDILIRSTVGVERLAQPTSGAVLTFSTVDGTSRPLWSIPTSGAILIASSVGVPTWRAIGTSGQILQSTGGSPAWVTPAAAGSTSNWLFGLDTSQAIAAAAHVVINWTSEYFDTDNFHSTVTASSLVTITVAGTYLIGASVEMPTPSTAILRVLEGTTLIAGITRVSGSIEQSMSLSFIYNFPTTGSAITVTVLSGTTNELTPLDVDYGKTLFWGHRLS